MNTLALVGITIALGSPAIAAALALRPQRPSVSSVRISRRLSRCLAGALGGFVVGSGIIVAAANPFIPQVRMAEAATARPPLFATPKL